MTAFVRIAEQYDIHLNVFDKNGKEVTFEEKFLSWLYPPQKKVIRYVDLSGKGPFGPFESRPVTEETFGQRDLLVKVNRSEEASQNSSVKSDDTEYDDLDVDVEIIKQKTE